MTCFKQRQPYAGSLITQHVLSEAHIGFAVLPLAVAPTGIAEKESTHRKKKAQFMVSAKADHRSGTWQELVRVTQLQIQYAGGKQRIGDIRKMACAWRIIDRLLREPERICHLAEGPEH